MALPVPPFVKRYLSSVNQWFWRTPDRALRQAYEAALAIQAIEERYFQGQKVDSSSCPYSESVFSYLQAELSKYLSLARLRLAEFRTSRTLLGISGQILSTSKPIQNASSDSSSQHETRAEGVLEQLRFIDEVIAKYRDKADRVTPSTTPSSSSSPSSSALVALSKTESTGAHSNVGRGTSNSRRQPVQESGRPKPSNAAVKVGTFADKTGFLPRSILRTFDRIRRELNPQAEEEVVKSFRSSKTKTIVSIRFILLLILVPLLMQELSKKAIIGPVVDQIRGDDIQVETLVNRDIRQEALAEFQMFEEELKFKSLMVGATHHLSEAEMEEKLREKTFEIAQEQQESNNNAIKNIFADFVAFLAFGGVIFWRRQEVTALKSFMDDIVYGLSDSAKAFIIILFTDMFVGFHSPHGWEVILEGVSRHLGIPENREFIFLFIATFPVILDTVFKYWIFRYLNRISPSAVATYRNMNE